MCYGESEVRILAYPTWPVTMFIFMMNKPMLSIQLYGVRDAVSEIASDWQTTRLSRRKCSAACPQIAARKVARQSSCRSVPRAVSGDTRKSCAFVRDNVVMFNVSILRPHQKTALQKRLWATVEKTSTKNNEKFAGEV